MSVTLKKFKSGIFRLIDPDTYSKKNFDLAKTELLNKRRELISILLLLSPAFFIYLPFRITRTGRARREFFLNQSLKRKFLMDELQLKSRKMRLRELKSILNEYE